MTKRRKAYQERREKQMQGKSIPNPFNVNSEYRKRVQKEYNDARDNILFPPKANPFSWLANARKQFGIQMFNDIADDYNSKNK